MANYDFTYTGAEIQAILDTAKKLKDSGYIFLGVATPSTNPGTPTQKVYYEAKQAGTYTNFGGVVLPDGISLLKWNGSWTSETVMCGDGGVFDISVYKSSGGTLATFADLSAALDGGNNIPVSARKGGMSVKFVQSSDNNYIRYNLLADTFTTDTTKWAIDDAGVYVENPEFLKVITDKDGKILWAIKTDGGIYYGEGVPQQVIDYINEKIAELSLDEYEDIVAFLNDLEKGDKTLQTLLNEKVDKVEGKSLIDTEFAAGVYHIENPEFVGVWLDNEEHILFGVQTDGNFLFGYGVPQQVKDYIEEKISSLSLDEYDDIVAFLGNLYEGDKTLQQLLNEKVDKIDGKGLIASDVAGSLEYIDNPESIYAKTDSEERLIEEIKPNGNKKIHVPVEIGDAAIFEEYKTKKVGEKITLLLDSDDKIISYRDKTGKLHEAMPTNQDDILQEQIDNIDKDVKSIEAHRNDIYHGKSSSYLWGEYIKVTNPLGTITERSHVEPQALAAKAKVDAFIGNDTNCVVFPIITDVHDNGSRISIAEDIINSSKYIQYDFIPQLGDIGLEGTCYSSISRMERWAKMYAAAHQGVPPILSVKGNHDVLCDYFGDVEKYDRSGIFVDELAYANYLQTPIMRRNGNIHWVYNKSYLYYDIPSKRVRVIMLNSCEDNFSINRYGFYYYNIDQIQWVIDTLNSTPNDYNVLVMGHRTPCRADLHGLVPPNGTILAKIMEDFNAHASGVNTQHGLSWDFTGKSNKVISQISGDCHVDAQGTANGLNYIISQGQANWTSNGSKSDITFTENFDYETTMFCDVVCIKPSEQKIKIIKMGWNNDSLDRMLDY